MKYLMNDNDIKYYLVQLKLRNANKNEWKQEYKEINECVIQRLIYGYRHNCEYCQYLDTRCQCKPKVV